MDVRMVLLGCMVAFVVVLSLWWLVALSKALGLTLARAVRPARAHDDPRHPLRALLRADFLAVAVIVPLAAWPLWPRHHTTICESREAAVASVLATMRQATELYRLDHDGELPDEHVQGQLAGRRDADDRRLPWAVHDDGERCGPYLRHAPANPIDPDAARWVRVVRGMPAAPDGSSAWLYCQASGEWRANTPGLGPSGLPYFDL